MEIFGPMLIRQLFSAGSKGGDNGRGAFLLREGGELGHRRNVSKPSVGRDSLSFLCSLCIVLSSHVLC